MEIITHLDALAKKIKDIDISNDLSVDTIIQRFRNGYELSEEQDFSSNEHIKYITKNEILPALLWFDWTVANNAYQAKKQQVFFALFSKDSGSLTKREPTVRLYNHYLEHSPQKHIDIFLQLSYIDENIFETRKNFNNDKKTYFDVIHKNGFVLHFNNLANKTERIIIPQGDANPLEIHLFQKDINLINKIKQQYITQQEKYQDINAKVDFFEQILDKVLPIKKEIAQINETVGIESQIYSLLYETFDAKDAVYKTLIRTCVINSLLDDELAKLYFIPIPSPKNMQIGHITCGVAESFEEKNIPLLRILAYELLYPVVQAIEKKNYFDIIRQESIKSAISAIMSRNMSHNLGSHFISNTKNYFAKKAEELDCADLRGIRHVLQYTQERMDYIATIVSGDQYPLGALNVKAQFFDELTINDFADRHDNKTTNFFLKYLVFSEKYSIDNGEEKPAGFQNIALQVKYDGEIFTGKPDLETENNIKTKLSQLNLAVPGGIMARHALFNIVENVMRNSAKHSKVEKDEGLVFTLEIKRLRELEEEEKTGIKETYRNKNNLLRIQIYDNKRNGQNIVEDVKKRMSQIHTLNTSGNMNKENKGLKEMLICVLWLQNENISKVLMKIDNAPDDTERLGIIEEYFRAIVRDGSLGYEFELPEFEKIHTLKPEELKADKIIEICADIVRYDIEDVEIENGKGEKEKKNLYEIFPRFSTDLQKLDENLECSMSKSINENDKNDTEDYNMLFKSVNQRLLNKNLSGYENLYIERKEENSQQKINTANESFDDRIVFENHLDTDSKDNKKNKYNETYKNAIYVDSISGSNFTKTITSDDFLKNNLQKYKLIESALTKIVIIDERIFEKVCSKEAMATIVENMLKDKSITNAVDFYNEVESKNSEIKSHQEEITTISREEYNTENGKNRIREILRTEEIEETVFRRKNIFLYDIEKTGLVNLSKNNCGSIGAPFTLNEDEKRKWGNEVHFISIHLGLLEKLITEFRKTNEKLKINYLMDTLKQQFNAKFIVVHSGRGNFSADLEDDLKDYPFISLSALEAAFDNSKYFLSQLFYNTIYYGKGNFNNQ